MKSLIFYEAKKEKELLEYSVKEDTQFQLVVVVPRGRDTNVCIRVRLTGRGARAHIIGLVTGNKKHQISIHTEQIHEAPDTTSNLLVKTILMDSAGFAYDGIIRVERFAQKSDAYQKNENLLLSPYVHARSDPALEILANDVRCTHGSTTGTIPEDQLWYLMSRGLSRPTATQLLVEGFFEHAIGMVSDTIIQSKIRKMV